MSGPIKHRCWFCPREALEGVNVSAWGVEVTLNVCELHYGKMLLRPQAAGRYARIMVGRRECKGHLRVA